MRTSACLAYGPPGKRKAGAASLCLTLHAWLAPHALLTAVARVLWQVYLVGRQRVTVNKSWCMYGSHSPTTMCDYCVPSACLRALLRLMSLPGGPALAVRSAIAPVFEWVCMWVCVCVRRIRRRIRQWQGKRGQGGSEGG